LTVVIVCNYIDHHDVTRKLTGNYGVSIVTVVTRTRTNVMLCVYRLFCTQCHYQCMIAWWTTTAV